MDVNKVGAILALIFGVGLGVLAGYLMDSVIVGIIASIIAFGYLFGQWVEAGVPYDIHDIRNEMKKKD